MPAWLGVGTQRPRCDDWLLAHIDLALSWVVAGPSL